ncbi:MAG: hypothetical protein Q8P23_03190 [bacterium]|nr:hypothetical protein [bacterium]
MNILNSIGPFLKRLHSRASFDPVRDWLMMLTLSAIALVGIIIWNVWAFDTIVGGGTIGAPITRAPAAFSKTSLDAITAIFANRAAEEAKYEIGVYRFMDPSQ